MRGIARLCGHPRYATPLALIKRAHSSKVSIGVVSGRSGPRMMREIIDGELQRKKADGARTGPATHCSQVLLADMQTGPAAGSAIPNRRHAIGEHESLDARVLRRREHGPPKIGRIFRMSATDILADILRLPTEERARLAHELIRSLDGEPDDGAAQAWDAEIERRGAEVDRGVADTMTFDEYRAHIRQRRAARPNR
jgi:putative addiction module component (TIGR02574 family)